MYFAYGETDVVLITDFPDTTSMTAVSMAVRAGGALQARATPC